MTSVTSEKIKILFLCTGNSCRSQMAEAWTNTLHSDSIQAYSAGIETHGLNPLAVKVMQSVGIDMSAHNSKLMDEFDLHSFDYIITVCDQAHESCPVVPRVCTLIHRSFDDPPRLTKNLVDDEAILACYCRVRDDIKDFIQELPDYLMKESKEK